MRLPLTVLIAFASGWVSLSYEILWYRTFAYVTWGTSTIFALLLAAFLLGIAMGARRAKALCEGGDRSVYLSRLAWLLLAANAVCMLVVPMLAFASKLDWRPVLLLVVLGAGLMGAVLPVLAQFGIDPDPRAGYRLALVYTGNIGGSALGSLLTGFVLMDVLSTQAIGTSLASVGFVTAFAVTLLVPGALGARTRARVGPLAVLGIAAVWIAGGTLYGTLYERLLYKERYMPARAFKRMIENRHGVVAVATDDTVWGGGGYDGAFNVRLDSDKNFIHRAFAVEALRSQLADAPASREILMIGLGSGSWAQVVANLPSTSAMTVIELNPAYTTLVSEHPAVASLLRNPRVTIVNDDGRRWLLRHPNAKFDFIVMNTAIAWRAHMTNLLSIEFLQIVRRHLLPWGIHYFNASDAPFELCSRDVLRTAVAAFPHVMRVMSFIAVSDAPFDFDRAAWDRTLAETRIDGSPVLDPSSPARERLNAFATSLDDPDGEKGDRMESRESIMKRMGPGEIVTDDNMLPEIRHLFALPAGAP